MTKLKPTNKTITEIMEIHNTDFDGAVSILCETQDYDTAWVLEELGDEARREDEREEYEFETASENAWLTKAEYDPEAQDEMRREDEMSFISLESVCLTDEENSQFTNTDYDIMEAQMWEHESEVYELKMDSEDMMISDVASYFIARP